MLILTFEGQNALGQTGNKANLNYVILKAQTLRYSISVVLVIGNL